MFGVRYLDYYDCSDPRAWPDLVGRSKQKPKDARPKSSMKSIYSYKLFGSQIFAEAISIWGKPINIYKLNAILLQNMHLTKNGILCHLQHNIKNGILCHLQHNIQNRIPI